jgi:hypothetical protein
MALFPWIRTHLVSFWFSSRKLQKMDESLRRRYLALGGEPTFFSNGILCTKNGSHMPQQGWFSDFP